MSFEDFHLSRINLSNKINIILPENQNETDFIISKYNENASYINIFKNVYLYDKNPINSENFYKYIKPDIHYKQLDNVGRCDHTYLYHIVENYDNLNTLNVFLSGSTLLCENLTKLEIFNKLIMICNKSKNTVFFKNSFNLLELFTGFKIINHETNTDNNNIFSDNHVLDQYDGTYDEWYIENFGYRKVNYGSYCSILVLHKNHILQHPKKYYQKLITYLDKHNCPETGHFFERSWGAIFYPIDKKCIFNYSDFNKTIE